MSQAEKALKAFTDAAADAVGREIAKLRHEDKLRAAEHRALKAELEARIMSAKQLEQQLQDAIKEMGNGREGPRRHLSAVP